MAEIILTETEIRKHVTDAVRKGELREVGGAAETKGKVVTNEVVRTPEGLMFDHTEEGFLGMRQEYADMPEHLRAKLDPNYKRERKEIK